MTVDGDRGLKRIKRKEQYNITDCNDPKDESTLDILCY